MEAYADGKSECRHFAEREEALACYRGMPEGAVLRETTLEDVFLSVAEDRR